MTPLPRNGTHRAGGARLGLLFLLSLGILTAVVAGAALWEMRTSTLQSGWFTSLAGDVSWEVSPGPSPHILFPNQAPYDHRLGYSRLPRLIESASGQGFDVAEQARVSPRYQELVRSWRLFPIYREKSRGGLSIVDRRGELLSEARFPTRAYPSFDSIPPIVWQTLLFLENRSLLDPDQPLRNPAVEWPRLLRSTAELGLRYLGREGSIAGASTLATQIQKFRHSPDGLTSSPNDKLAQMASASVRAYLEGPQTLPARRRVVLEYLNSVPLAAQSGAGEVTGLGDGLWGWYGRELADANRVLRTLGSSPAVGPERGTIYREVLSLILSQRRPTYYLTNAEGREALQALTDRHLRLLERAEVISPSLSREALEASSEPRSAPPPRPPPAFVERKGVNAVRNQLLGTLGVPGLYDLDRPTSQRSRRLMRPSRGRLPISSSAWRIPNSSALGT